MEMEKSIDNMGMSTSQKVGNGSQKGGLRTMPFIIANEVFEKVASIGLHANMILYLRNEYHIESAKGTSMLFMWSALSNFMPIIGAFISDSYLGRFKVIAMGTITALFGLIALCLTSIFPQARPHHCIDSSANCPSAKPTQLLFLFSSFALMSIGAGGIRPCSLAFGADQLDNPNKPNNERVLQTFFNWYYASVGISVMTSVLLIVYIQNEAGWVVGFGVAVGLMLFSTLMFFLGSSLYVKVKPNKSLLTGFGQVIVSAWKNKHLAFPPLISNSWFFHKGSKFVSPTDKLRYLNKACIITNKEKDLNPEGNPKDPWNLCTIKQVEELKALIKVLPIWSTGIIISATINQNSFSTLQSSTMDRHIFPHSEFPAASFSVFGLLTLTIWVALYDRILVPHLSKFTKNPKGLSFEQRMGIGLAISCLASAVSAVVERKRRDRAIHQGLSDDPHAIVNMSALWLVPQHCLSGLAEAFNAIGQIEFYYSQFPKSMSSIAVALFTLGMAFGSLVGALVINVVDDFSKKRGGISWVSDNFNKGHYDYYYWILTVLGVVNLLYYVLCSWFYGKCEEKSIWDEEEEVIYDKKVQMY